MSVLENPQSWSLPLERSEELFGKAEAMDYEMEVESKELKNQHPHLGKLADELAHVTFCAYLEMTAQWTRQKVELQKELTALWQTDPSAARARTELLLAHEDKGVRDAAKEIQAYAQHRYPQNT